MSQGLMGMARGGSGDAAEQTRQHTLHFFLMHDFLPEKR